MSFFVRNLKQEESFGDKLRALRRHQNRTLREMSEVTKIQKKYLEAFELGKCENLPEPIYAKNFLKKYVAALGGDPEYFVALFEEKIKKCDLVSPHRLPAQRTRASAFFSAHRLWKFLLGSVFVATLAIYLGWQVTRLLAPPEIVILEPADGIEVQSASLVVKGSVNRESEIFVNNTRVVPDIDGNFSTKITLERGLNIITVEANTKHSKMSTAYRRVVLNQNPVNQPGLSTTPR
jgi:transcriptional regulator with XRE-family HTH domain